MPKDKFVFYSKSPDLEPGSYKGKDWSEFVNNVKDYEELQKNVDWRKMFSNFYISPFILDGQDWNSVEHFFHAVKFRDMTNDNNFEYYKTFTKNGNKPWSLDPEKSKYAGKAGRVSEKTGKVYDKKIDGEKVPKDVSINPDFYSKGIHKKAMTLAFFAKFAQNEILTKVLLSTNNAQLYHLITQRGQKSKLELWNHLMKVRDCISEYQDKYDLKELSKFDLDVVSRYL